MLKRICDRCGCDIKRKEFHHVHTCLLYSDRVNAQDNKEHDLCEVCYRALCKFLDEEKND